jgi:hypothetical protein
MVQGLREEVNGLVLGRERYHGNKNIASRSAKVSAREEDDNFLFSSCQKERFLKN